MTSDLERTRVDARTRVEPAAIAAAALAAFGLINAAAVAGGAWFGPIRWSVLRRAYAVVRD